MGFLSSILPIAGSVIGTAIGGPVGGTIGGSIGSMVGGGGSGGGQSSSASSAPWAPQQPYLQKGFQEADKLYDQGPQQYYPYQTVADVSTPTQAYWDNTYARATNGSPLVDAAQNTTQGFLSGNYSNPSSSYFNGVQNAAYYDNPASGYFEGAQGGDYLNSNPVNSYLKGTASGAYLNSNPYIDATYNQAADSITRNYQQAVAPGTDSAFENAGRYGSGLHANAQEQDKNALGNSLANLGTQIYGGNYANERQNQISAAGTIGNAYAGERSLQQGAAGDLSGIYQNQAARSDNAALANSNNYNTSRTQQLQAATLAPNLANQDYVDLQQQGNIGSQISNYQQQTIDAAKAKWDYEQQAPQTALQNYQNNISGNYGGQSTHSTQNQNGALAGDIGNLVGSFLGGSGGGSSSMGMSSDVIASPWQTSSGSSYGSGVSWGF